MEPPLTRRRLGQLGLMGCQPASALLAVTLQVCCPENLFGENRDPILIAGLALVLVGLCGVHLWAGNLPSPAALIGANIAIFLGVSLSMPACLLCARPQGQLTACKTNLKRIAGEVEIYSADHADIYPRSLSWMNLPRCPAADAEPYGYIATSKDFTVWCQGRHHRRAGIDAPNYPQYNAHEGLILPSTPAKHPGVGILIRAGNTN